MTDRTDPYVIDVSNDDDVPVVRLSGELDLRAAPELAEALASLVGPSTAAVRPRAAVFVEMSAVTFVDSSIISVLLSATKRATDSAGVVRLVAVPGNVVRVLEIAGVSDVLVSYPSLKAAEESLST